MSRAHLFRIALLALPLAACGKDAPAPPAPAPDPVKTGPHISFTLPPRPFPAPTAESTASASAEAPVAASGSAPASASAEAPVAASGSAPASASAAPKAEEKKADEKNAGEKKAEEKKATISPDRGLPKTKSGVLSEEAANKVLKVGALPIVQLIEPGGEPRSELRYAPAKGTSQKVLVTEDTSLSSAQGKAEIPTVKMVFDMTAADRNAAGDAKIDAMLSQLNFVPKAGQEAALPPEVRAQIDAIKGLSMAYWLSPRGQMRDLKVSLPSGAPKGDDSQLAVMGRLLERMAPALPAEAIGPGAKWQVVTRVANLAEDLLQSSIYTLRERSGNKATLEVQFVEFAVGETMKLPGLPPTIVMKRKAHRAGGGGVVKLDTAALAPDSASSTLKSSVTISVQETGSPVQENSVDKTTRFTLGKP